MSTKLWRVAEVPEQPARTLAASLDLPLPIARMLAARGFLTTAAAECFLRPRLSELSDPGLLPGLAAGAARIGRALAAQEPITVYGDYDADGLTSTALLVQTLRRLGARAVPFIPHRMDDGYGLSVEALARCCQRHQPRLLITVDCGTSAVTAVQQAQAAGVDVIVTDHHEPSGPVAPALAVINPKLGDHPGLRQLAGVGVAFKLCHALVRQAGARAQVDLREALDLVAVGTIADVVPLQDENRVLVRHGLARLQRTTSPGLQALWAVTGVQDPLEAWHVAFLLAPRLNAVGRLGDAETVLELLLTPEAGRAGVLARQLDAANRERQAVEQQIVAEAVREVDDGFDPERHFGVVVARAGWHPGVIGIVAARLCQRYRRPAVVIAIAPDGACRGSCRSIEEFDLVAQLAHCADTLDTFGGHALAAGLTLTADRLPAFKKQFNAVAAERLQAVDLRPVQRVDAWVALREVDDRLLSALDLLRPFGQSNAEPIWAARGVRVVAEPRVLAKDTLKLTVETEGTVLDAVGFGMGQRPVPPGLLDIAFHARNNVFRGRTTLQLNLQDFRPTGPA